MNRLKEYPRPSRPSNPSSLEMAIYNFELLAKKYFDKKATSNPSKALLEQLNIDFRHLQREKDRISSISIAQAALAEYRDESSKATIEKLTNEEHHPTNKLAKFLTAIGEPKPTPNHEAHHIIPGVGRFDKFAILSARLNFHLVGFGINDPINGTWLINFMKNKDIDWATESAPAHRKLHRYNYESWIGINLGGQRKPNKEQFSRRLSSMKTHIKTGTLPNSIFDAKDEQWKGL